jgi:hypothetical protein
MILIFISILLKIMVYYEFNDRKYYLFYIIMGLYIDIVVGSYITIYLTENYKKYICILVNTLYILINCII